MDITKTVQLAAEVKAAADRMRPFFDFANKVVALADAVHPVEDSQFAPLEQKRADLEAAIATLTDTRTRLAAEVTAMQRDFNQKSKQAQVDHQALLTDLKAQRDNRLAELQAEVQAAQEHHKAILAEQQNQLQAVAAQKTTVEQQIASLRSSFQQASQALHG